MNAKELLKSRRSVRKFADEKINHNQIKEIIETTLYAPSWMNTQISRFTVIDDKTVKAKFAKEVFGDIPFNLKTVNGAAGIIVLSYVNGISGYDPNGNKTSKGDTWSMFDAGIASLSLVLALHEQGIGSVILGGFNEISSAKFVELPENEIVAAIIPYGYAASEVKVPPRKSVEEILRFK